MGCQLCDTGGIQPPHRAGLRAGSSKTGPFIPRGILATRRGDRPVLSPASPAGGAPRNFGAFAARRIQEVIQNGSMPPEKYTMIHPAAKLTDAERQQLLQGLTATLSQTTPQ